MVYVGTPPPDLIPGTDEHQRYVADIILAWIDYWLAKNHVVHRDDIMAAFNMNKTQATAMMMVYRTDDYRQKTYHAKGGFLRGNGNLWPRSKKNRAVKLVKYDPRHVL